MPWSRHSEDAPAPDATSAQPSKYQEWVGVSGFKGAFMRFWHHENFWVSLLRDLVVALLLLAALALALYLYAGVWPPMVSVEGNSMYPHMHDGDLVFLQGLGRTGVVTYEEGKVTGYRTYEDYGDVIIYWPYGDKTVRPIIHRAMYWVDQGEPMWEGGPAAPWGGYITLGDNNNGQLDQWGIVYNNPVRPDWILGVSKFSLPWLGKFKLLF